MPVTVPEPALMVALADALLLQIPPDTSWVSVVVLPMQTVAVPVIPDSVLLMVIGTDLLQPVPSVYVMFAVPMVMA